jgi:hypothetical protein
MMDNDGFVLLPAVFAVDEVETIAAQLTSALAQAEGDLAIRTRGDIVYAARNVDLWFPAVKTLWRKPVLIELLRDLLGDDFGLVRVLFFDKPQEQPWSLPWHKDMTIAVQDNRLPSDHFRNPTTKAGIPHVEAPESVLEKMLTLRLHLDEVDDSNGPLLVVPASHYSGKQVVAGGTVEKILAGRGDVLAIRPLVSHSSPVPKPAAGRGRRILHFEFAASRWLPDGYRWRSFDAGMTEE